MVRQIFKNKVIAAAGPLPGQLTVDNLKKWTKLRKGHFSDVFNDSVTHLLCTEEQYRARVPRVQEGRKRGKKLHIIHYDWFEFSAVEEKKLSEADYSMQVEEAKKRAAERERTRVERGRRNGEKFVNTNFFHIYKDRTYFAYQIDITRDDDELGEPGQKYTLSLWESNAKPHLYWFTAKYTRRKGSSQPVYYRPSPCSGKWKHEMELFKHFFRVKTGIPWEERVVRQKATSLSLFQYSPPTGGKPVGRRLIFDYDYCREINAQLRGLPWPPEEEKQAETEEMEIDGPMAQQDDNQGSLQEGPVALESCIPNSNCPPQTSGSTCSCLKALCPQRHGANLGDDCEMAIMPTPPGSNCHQCPKLKFLDKETKDDAKNLRPPVSPCWLEFDEG